MNAVQPASGILGGAAEAVAASICEEASLDVGRGPLRELRDALLQEHADCDPAAADRCAKLRNSFAVAVLMALAKRPQAAALLKGEFLRHIQVEVRGTARRTMIQPVFSVGRAPECDIQMYGDVTLSRLQLIVVALPKAVIVIDAWSSGGTRVVRRSSTVAESLPCSVPDKRLAFVLASDESAILLIGQKTTLTVGPTLPHTQALRIPASVPALVEAAAKPAASAPAPAPVAAAQSSPAMATAKSNVCADRSAKTGVATSAVAHSVQPTPARAVSLVKSSNSPASSSTARPQAVAQPIVATAAAAEAVAFSVPDRQNSSLATAQDSSTSGEPAPSPSKRQRTGSVRAFVQRQLSAVWRKRVMARIQAAVRSQLLSESQGADLQTRIREAGAGEDEIRDILDGLGIPAAPDDPQYSLQPGAVVRLQGLEGSPELNGAVGTAEEWLASRGRWSVRLSPTVVHAIKSQNLVIVAQPVCVKVEPGRCPSGTCTVALTKEEEPRSRLECCCGASAVCSRCGLTPYHYHADCTKQDALRQRWLEWLRGGRDAYQKVCRTANREAIAHKRAMKEALQISAEREDAAGPVAVARAASPDVRRRLMAARAGAISGHGVCHLFTRCALCGTDGQCIVGPRFRCVHCPSFDCCLKCEPRLLAGEHDKQHVFEILFESEFDWASTGIALPIGTRARLRGTWEGHASGQANGTTGGGRKRRQHGMEGVIKSFKREKYELELDGVGIRHVAIQDLQPLLSQKQAERLLVVES